MKNSNYFLTTSFGALCFAFCLFIPWHTVFAQETGSPKAKARLSLEYFHNQQSGPYLKASAKTKVERSYEPITGETIRFYLIDGQKEFLGKSTTDEKGMAILPLPAGIVSPDDSIYSHRLEAAIEASERFKNKKKDLEVKESKLEVRFSGDSSHRISIFLTAPDSSGTMVPIPDKPFKSYVKRLFNPLPVGENRFSTDEEGRLELEFPDDIPGNATGMLTVIVTLEDDDEFGNLVLEKEVGWGVPVIDNEIKTKRELWSAQMNAPWHMVFIVNGLLLGIWVTILYIIGQLIKIRRLSKVSEKINLRNQAT